MKKSSYIVLSMLLTLGLTACETSIKDKSNHQETTDSTQKINAKKTLIVYFSMPETDQLDEMNQEEENSTVVIDGTVIGNTQYFANVLQECTNATIFRIEPETPYPTTHDILVDVASKEKEELARPIIKNNIENFEQYETVFIGYPNWWGDMPMILYSFFDEYDFTDKTIIPFNTHGGSGFSDTISSIQELEPNAFVLKQGLSISRNDIAKAKPQIVQWLNTLNMTND